MNCLNSPIGQPSGPSEQAEATGRRPDPRAGDVQVVVCLQQREQ